MEIYLIKILGVILGILAPGVLIFSLSIGVLSTHWDHKQLKAYWSNLLPGIITWSMLIVGLTYLGFFEYVDGDILPRFLIGLLIPVAVGLLALLSSDFGEILDQIPLKVLVGSQFFRIFGSVFFLIASTGIGPKEFVTSGYGDTITGVLACITAWMLYRNINGAISAVWAFSIVGLLDLLNVSRILLINYPTWSNADPSTAFAGSFPLMLIVGLAAPVALLLHVYTIRALAKIRAN